LPRISNSARDALFAHAAALYLIDGLKIFAADVKDRLAGGPGWIKLSAR